jgi:UDP-2,3-diacylglucosamine pyrophosphatase LpxH
MGDAIVIEVVDKFADLVETELKGRAPEGLREIDNVRPLQLVPTWVNSLVRKSDPDTAREVRRIWNKVVEQFLKVPFVARHHFNLIKWGLRLSEGLTFAALDRIVRRVIKWLTWLAGISRLANWVACRLGLSSDVYKCAQREKAFVDDAEISYIVYGHTHRHEIVPLRTASATEGKPKAAYLNAGTWRAVFDLVPSRSKNKEFFPYHVMTYLAFFNKDERKDPGFETWSGSFESPIVRDETLLRKVQSLMPWAA